MTMTENQLSDRKSLSSGELARLLGASIGPALRLVFDRATLRQWPRLLTEGINPIVHLLIQANNTALIKQWLNNGTQIVFLCSYPRSGNTWMRFMLCDVLLQMHGVETTTQLPARPDDLIPEFRGNSIIRRLSRCPHWASAPETAFVKTHSLIDRLEQIVSDFGPPGSRQHTGGGAALRGCKVLYLYRSADDALVSFYHFCLREPEWQCRTTVGLEAFCRKEVLGWMQNLESYLRAAENGVPVFFVSYEQLLQRPTTVMSDVLQWLGVHNNSELVRRAVSNMQFDKLQSMEAQEDAIRLSANEKQRFFRRGYPGSGRAELTESTLREIHLQTASLMSQANRREMSQSTELPPPSAAASNPSDTEAPLRNGESKEPKKSPCLK